MANMLRITCLAIATCGMFSVPAVTAQTRVAAPRVSTVAVTPEPAPAPLLDIAGTQPVVLNGTVNGGCRRPATLSAGVNPRRALCPVSPR